MSLAFLALFYEQTVDSLIAVRKREPNQNLTDSGRVGVWIRPSKLPVFFSIDS
jgi:hypothetical protein